MGLAVAALLVVAAIAVPWRAARLEEAAIRDWSGRLDMVAEGARLAIDSWLESVRAMASFADLAAPGEMGPVPPAEVTVWRRLVAEHRYEAIRLVDSAGVTLAASDGRPWPVQEAVRAEFLAVSGRGAVASVREVPTVGGSRILLDVAVVSPQSRRFAVVSLDPSPSLSRFLPAYTSLSESGECFLVPMGASGRAARPPASRLRTRGIRVAGAPAVMAALERRETAVVSLTEEGVPRLVRTKPLVTAGLGLVCWVDRAEVLQLAHSRLATELLVLAVLCGFGGWVTWRLWWLWWEGYDRELESSVGQLRSTREHLAVVQEIAHMGRWEWDLERDLSEWSPEIFSMLAQPPDAVPGPDAFLARVPPDDRERVEAELLAPMRAGQADATTLRLTLPDGGERIVRCVALPQPGPDGRPVRIVVTMQDVTDLKLTEQAARLLASAVEQTMDSVMITDREGVIQYVNQGFMDLTGFSRDEALGQTPQLLRSGAQSPEFYAQMWSTIQSGKRFRGLLDDRRRDGTLFSVQKSITPIRDEHGRITHFVSVDSDMTARKRSDEALRAIGASAARSGEDIFMLLARQAAAALDVRYACVLAVTDRPDQHARIVASWLDGAPGPAREYLLEGSPCGTVLLGETVCIATDARRLFENQPFLRDLDPESYCGVPLADSHGRVSGVIFVLDRRPIEDAGHTQSVLGVFAARAAAELERLRSAQALQRSEVLHRSLVRTAPFGIFRASQDGRILAANPALAAMLGYASQVELCAAACLSDLYEDVEAWKRHAAEDVWSGHEVAWHRRDGTPLAVILTGRVELDPDEGRVLQGVVQDVTERRSLEGQLRQAQKMEAIGNLTGGIAHDFNNLLTVIQFNAELVSAALPEDSAVLRGRLASLLHATQRGASLVRKLLAFSRRERLDVGATDIGQLVEELAVVLRRLVPENIELRLEIRPGLPQAWADPVAMEQILLNLVTNACDAMSEGGVLTVAAAAALAAEHDDAWNLGLRGAFLRLTVTDTGTGMDDATLSHVFEPFFTLKPVGSGSGLGLSMVYGLVKQMGGFVHIRSEPGYGTRVELALLLAPEDGNAVVVADDKDSVLRGHETILLVEDEVELRHLARELLELYGYRVLLAANGREAIERVAASSPAVDIVVTDIVMPRMGGRELLAELRVRRPGLRVVFTSGYPDLEAGQPAGLDTGVPFVRKPWDVGDLLWTVRATLDRPAGS